MNVKTQVKNQFTKCLLTLASQLSIPAAQTLGKFLGALFWYFPSRTKSVTSDNIQACFPNLSSREQTQLAKYAFRNTLITGLEAGPIWFKALSYGQSFISSVSNEHLLVEALKDVRGLILILPHLGNWEMTNQYIAEKTSVIAMYKPAKIPNVETKILTARTRAGVSMVPADQSGVAKIFRALKKGGTTIILPDQEPSDGAGIFTSFFGVPALTGKIVPRLIQKTQAQALIIFCKRIQETGRFEICIRQPDPNLFSEDLIASTTALNLSLEKVICECLDQYQWSYKRFKSRPDSEQQPFYLR